MSEFAEFRYCSGNKHPARRVGGYRSRNRQVLRVYHIWSFIGAVCALHEQDRPLRLLTSATDWAAPAQTTGTAAMSSREELEAEALSLFTGIGLVENTAK